MTLTLLLYIQELMLAAIPDTARWVQPMVWTQTQKADENTAQAPVISLSSCQPFLSPPIEWESERRLDCTSSCGIRWLFFSESWPYDPALPSFLPHLSHNWSACTQLPTVRLPKRVRERILCNLWLPWWLWGTQLLPPIPSHLTLFPTVVILKLSAGRELCSDWGEGILS